MCHGPCRREDRANHPVASGASLPPPIVRPCPKGHRESPPFSGGNETCALRPGAIGRERTSNWCRAPYPVCNANNGFSQEGSPPPPGTGKRDAKLGEIDLA